MTAQAQLHRCLLRERRHTRWHVPTSGRLDVPARGAVTRFAIDRQTLPARGRSSRHAALDLTAVTLLAAGEAIVIAEHALGRPVAAVGEAELRRDRLPAASRARACIAEPDAI